MRRFLIAAVLVATAAAPVRGQLRDNTQIEVTNLAKDVAAALAKDGHKEVRLGRFTGKGDYAPATVDPGAPTSKLMYIRINAQLVNTKTRLPLATEIAPRALYGNEVLGRAFAPNVALSPTEGMPARNLSLKIAIEKPAV